MSISNIRDTRSAVERCGFASVESFRVAFRKVVGLAPSFTVSASGSDDSWHWPARSTGQTLSLPERVKE